MKKQIITTTLFLMIIITPFWVSAKSFYKVVGKGGPFVDDAVVELSEALRNNDHKVVYGSGAESTFEITVKEVNVKNNDMLKLSVKVKGGPDDQRVVNEYCSSQMDFRRIAQSIIARLAPRTKSEPVAKLSKETLREQGFYPYRIPGPKFAPNSNGTYIDIIFPADVDLNSFELRVPKSKYLAELIVPNDKNVSRRWPITSGSPVKLAAKGDIPSGIRYVLSAQQ